MNKYFYGFATLFILFFLTACDDRFLGTADLQPIGIASSTNFKIRMTDAPIDYEEVNIDLQGVIIYGKTKNESDSIELGTNAGIYNLLDFQNGLDTLIASAMLTVDTVKQVKLLLGENNSVKVDGEIFPLTIPGNAKNGLRIKLCIPLTDLTEYVLNIDFDAKKSVIETGNGFKLKPVIKVLNPNVAVTENEEEIEETGSGDDDGKEEDNNNDDDDDTNTPKDTIDLSETIWDYLETEYADYKVKSVDSISLCTEAVYIQVGIQNKNVKINLFFDYAGTFIQKTTSLKKKDIPEVILKTLAIDFKGFKPTNSLHKVLLADETVQFQLTIRKGNEEKTILFAADGTVVCEF